MSQICVQLRPNISRKRQRKSWHTSTYALTYTIPPQRHRNHKWIQSDPLLMETQMSQECGQCPDDFNKLVAVTPSGWWLSTEADTAILKMVFRFFFFFPILKFSCWTYFPGKDIHDQRISHWLTRREPFIWLISCSKNQVKPLSIWWLIIIWWIIILIFIQCCNCVFKTKVAMMDHWGDHMFCYMFRQNVIALNFGIEGC